MNSDSGRIPTRSRDRAALAIIIALQIGLYLWHSPLMLHSDDFVYSRTAHEILSGTFTLTHSLETNRLGLTLPVALSYRLAGINRYSTTVFPLAGGMLTLLLVYRIADNLRRGAGIFASLLLLLSLPQLEGVVALYPDMPASALVLLSAAVLFSCRTASRTAPIFGAVFAVSLFWAGLTKETAVYALPFFFFLFLSDMRARRARAFWGGAVSAGILLALVYFGVCAYLSGDPFRRFASLDLAHAAFTAPPPQSFRELFARLSYRPFGLLLGAEFGFVVCFAIPALCASINGSGRSDGSRYWSGYLLSLAICLWFFSTSLRIYNPTPLVARYWLYLLAPSAIFGGLGIAAMLDSGASAGSRGLTIATLALHLCAAGLQWASGSPFSSLFYLIAAVLLAGFRIAPAMPLRRGLLFMPPLLVMMLYLKASEPNMSVIEQRVLREYLASEHYPRAIVIADKRLVDGHQFYFGHRPSPHLRFFAYEQARTVEPRPGEAIFVIGDWNRNRYDRDTYGRYRPRFFEFIPGPWETVIDRGNAFGGRYALMKVDSIAEFQLGY